MSPCHVCSCGWLVGWHELKPVYCATSTVCSLGWCLRWTRCAWSCREGFPLPQPPQLERHFPRTQAWPKRPACPEVWSATSVPVGWRRALAAVWSRTWIGFILHRFRSGAKIYCSSYFPISQRGIFSSGPVMECTAVGRGTSLVPYMNPGRRTTPVSGNASNNACSARRFPLK